MRTKVFCLLDRFMRITDSPLALCGRVCVCGTETDNMCLGCECVCTHVGAAALHIQCCVRSRWPDEVLGYRECQKRNQLALKLMRRIYNRERGEGGGVCERVFECVCV